MSISHALLVNPLLELHQRELHLEQKKMQELSYWAYNYTSFVSQHSPHILTLEIGRSKLLFKDLENIINLIKDDLISFKIESLLGLANTPKAAILLSSKDQKVASNVSNIESQINSVSLNTIDQPLKTITKLKHCGFKTLGDIKHIKHADLGARFGKELLTYLKQVYGDLADPQEAITPPEVFEKTLDFSEPISNNVWIQQQMDKLLDELSAFIDTRQLLCRSFVWQFFHENNRLIKSITIGITKQHKLNSTLKKLSSLSLENTQLKWEFSRITLSCKDLMPGQLFNVDLFDTTPSKEQFQQLKDTLISRLGNNAIYGIEAKPEYLPEMAHQKYNKYFVQEQEKAPTYQALYQDKNSRKILPQHEQPLWLLKQPSQIGGHGMVPNLEGPLFLIHGPNRLSSQWWSKLQSRDYFIARQNNGRLLWVFFDRVQKHWFLHGTFG